MFNEYDKNFWELYSFVVRSKYRKLVLSVLSEKPHMPSEIAKKLNVHTAHVSRALRELELRNIIRCVTPRHKKGRIYILTEIGKKIFDIMNK